MFVLLRHTDGVGRRGGGDGGCKQLLKLAMCNLLYSRRGRIRAPTHPLHALCSVNVRVQMTLLPVLLSSQQGLHASKPRIHSDTQTGREVGW